MRRVAMHVAIGHWRRFARERPLHEFVVSPADPTGSNLEVLLALRKVPIHQRSALFLRRDYGQRYGWPSVVHAFLGDEVCQDSPPFSDWFVADRPRPAGSN